LPPVLACRVAKNIVPVGVPDGMAPLHPLGALLFTSLSPRQTCQPGEHMSATLHPVPLGFEPSSPA
jgi:hypothetical protein